MKYYMLTDSEAQYVGQSRTERNKKAQETEKNLSSSWESEDRAGH